MINSSYNRLLEKNNEIEYSTKTKVLIEYDKNKVCKMSMDKKIRICNFNDISDERYLLMTLDTDY